MRVGLKLKQMNFKKLSKADLINKAMQLANEKSILEQDIDYLNDEICEYDNIVEVLRNEVESMKESRFLDESKLSINQSNELDELLINFKNKHNI